jgi:small subunit ribosomal protein S16
VAVKIKLKRMGKIRAPYYRVVVADSRTKRDGRAIEEIGIYHPKEDPSRMEVNSERVAYWLGVGAQPTDPVLAILKRTGDWQAFKGEPAPPPLLMAKPKESRTESYQAAVALAHADVDDSKAVGKAGSGSAPRRTKGKSATDGAEASADAATDNAPADSAPTANDTPAADATATEAAPESAPTEGSTEASTESDAAEAKA